MKELFGGCLIAVGALIAGATGLCSIGLLVNGIVTDPLRALGAIAFYGGIPFAIGVGLIMAGRNIIRRSRTDANRWTDIS